MTRDLREEESLEAIVKSHPEPKNEKLESHLMRLESMRNYYKGRAANAEPEQLKLFIHIDNALSYSITIINMYRQLTRRLLKLKGKK